MANTKISDIYKGDGVVVVRGLDDKILEKLLEAEFKSGVFLERQKLLKMVVEDLNYFSYWDFDQLKRHLDKTQEKYKEMLK